MVSKSTSSVDRRYWTQTNNGLKGERLCPIGEPERLQLLRQLLFGNSLSNLAKKILKALLT